MSDPKEQTRKWGFATLVVDNTFATIADLEQGLESI